MLKIRNLQAGYGQLKILKNLSMHVNPGEIVAIIGANGAGKTTLLNACAGLVKPYSGEIQFDDTETTRLKPEEIAANGCVLVPEGRQLFRSMTVLDNLMMGAYKTTNKIEIERRMERVHALFPKLQERRKQYAGTLSGGEQQMLAIGRAMMADPRMIMMDEPSMGLAPLIIRSIFEVIGTLGEEGKTILIVEQNARAALRVAKRGYVLETGTILLEGDSRELLENRDVQRAYLGKEYKHIND